MYKSAKAHRHSDGIFMANDWIVYNFLLITLWVVIFVVNILFCVGEGTAGVIVTTVWSGLEWITLLLLAILTIAEVHQKETSDPVTGETQPLLNTQAGQTAQILTRVYFRRRFSNYRKNLTYFISYTLCTLSLALAVDIHIVILFNVIAFFLTAPHHIVLYINAMRPGASEGIYSFLSRPTHVAYLFFLAALWCGIVILDILLSRELYQSILLAIFGGLECIMLAALAVRSVVDELSGGQIKL
ncbi:hypothetical protein H0H92_003916 [Tricholoma furcatifolium]|nr:hypothetical protein H0H92_003916 [Tricholoma furcatifolium]